MNSTCFIINKDPHNSLLLEKYINSTKGLEYIGTVTNIASALDSLGVVDQVPDLIFVDAGLIQDIDMDILRKFPQRSLLIFTGDHAEQAAKAFRCHAVDFLLNPIEYPHFMEAIQKAKRILENSKKELVHFFVRESMGGTLVRIEIAEILYLESFGNYVKVFYAKDKHYLVHRSMRKLMRDLPAHQFFRIQQSLAVHIAHIHNVTEEVVNLKNGTRLKIGYNYKKAFLDRLLNRRQ